MKSLMLFGRSKPSSFTSSFLFEKIHSGLAFIVRATYKTLILVTCYSNFSSAIKISTVSKLCS